MPSTTISAMPSGMPPTSGGWSSASGPPGGEDGPDRGSHRHSDRPPAARALRSAGPEQLIHPLGRFPPDRRHDVAVRVEREADLRVPKRLHHDASRDTLGEQERGAGMPQVVEPLTGETGIGKDPLAVSYTHLRAHETRHDLVCR